jgi:hypothetical protein
MRNLLYFSKATIFNRYLTHGRTVQYRASMTPGEAVNWFGCDPNQDLRLFTAAGAWRAPIILAWLHLIGPPLTQPPWRPSQPRPRSVSNGSGN